MIDHSNAEIEHISVHFVGNKAREEELGLSTSQLDIPDVRAREFLFRYFLDPFTIPEFYAFSSPERDHEMNPMFNFAHEIFKNSEAFHDVTLQIARYLYQITEHPNIKAGDLFIVYFSNINVEDEVSDAVGIFKCESRDAFLKLLREQEERPSVEWHEGISIDKLDKGCVIFNTERSSGYRVCIVDRSNKSEAQFWRDSFLQLQPRNDDYHYTKEFINITKDFVTEQMSDELDFSKADQIDMLNRSALYFKSHDKFEMMDFETEVLQDPRVISSFREFDESARDTRRIPLDNQFEISPEAVRKHGRVFKSVLKLDKNFHIYIHGDRDLIQQGRENDGRKYYKIYFDKEA